MSNVTKNPIPVASPVRIQLFDLLGRLVGEPVNADYEAGRHLFGLFPRSTWLRLLGEIGFQSRIVPFTLRESADYEHEAFVAIRPPDE